MSTKIYDAYVLDKNYSLLELDQICKKVKEKSQTDMNKRFISRVVEDFLYYYNTKRLNGDEWVREMLEKTKNNIRQNRIWKSVLNAEWSSLWIDIYTRTTEIIDHPKNHLEDMVACSFKSSIQIFPIKNKTLVMYFGSSEGQKILEECGYVSDYHYQNQTDRPDNILEKEWKQRAMDWENAIGPDYIPINHGFTVKLCNTNKIPFFRDAIDDWNPQKEENLFKRLRESMLEMDNLFREHGINTSSYSDVSDFMKSSEYKKWAKNADDQIQGKCVFPKCKEELIDILEGGK